MKRIKFATSLNEQLIKDIKFLALKNDLKINDLLEEGMQLILEKYRNEKRN